jgi:hypothetical protein
MHIERDTDRISALLEESTDARFEPLTRRARMTDPVQEEPLDVTKVDDPNRVPSLGKGSPYIIDPITGRIGFLSPPGTPPVTSEDVRRWLEDFP